MGVLLTAAASTFYTEEPVREFMLFPPSSPKDVAKALQLLRDVMRCRFVARPDYYEKRLMLIHYHDANTGSLCSFSKELCLSPLTTETMCLAAHVRLARVVVLDLERAAPVLQDSDLDTHAIHLVRDPRGVLTSRETLSKNGYFAGEALNASFICDRYRRDMRGAAAVKASVPHRCSHPSYTIETFYMTKVPPLARYTLLRYEDLSLNTTLELRRLYDILGLAYTARVASKVAYHTLGMAEDLSYIYGTTRDSKATVFRWRSRLSFAEMKEIQDACLDVLQAYGYRVFASKEEYEDQALGVLVPIKT
ncbi:carbohydrate sulfotransferase 5-like [Penaeus chinensis]|uniref:carbohydrate sulfotransferase 5-like n=1 Tax=Penaeus chinensis TaxID=139456 RepID=UPI001FB5CFE2|nr:carbohydrate sulfotransferase 5-like [Penaeus chinensis]